MIFLDLNDANCERGEVYFNKFLPFLQLHGKPHQFRSFILIYIKKFPLQKDAHNCGVFVLLYFETILQNLYCHLENLFFDPDFKPSDYRDYLKKVILEKSDDMSKFCL